MARVETWFRCFLSTPIKTVHLNGVVFNSDKQANIIGVEVFGADGRPENLAGTVSANVILSNGDTINISSGTINENKCYVVLPQTVYAQPGLITITIKITNGTSITTLAHIIANVFESSTNDVV